MQEIIIVTGGSRGIGAATVRKAAERGYAVCINYRSNHKAAERLRDEIIRGGGKAIAVAADVSVEEDVLRMFEIVDKQLGPVTALVNNAAILPKAKPVREMTFDRVHEVFTTNVIGPFICAREAIKRMAKSCGGNGGRIVNVSSIVAKYGSPNEANDYSGSKAALEVLTIGLAREVSAEGIRVNAVRPSMIHTDMVAHRLHRAKHVHPLQRPGTPEEVANTIMWLLSEEASYVAGAIVDVNGGR
ncbi:MAG TPA: SDR family oxidoreductase [Cyclobacteriaceae bacterium]